MKIFSCGADWYTATNVLNDSSEAVSLMARFMELSETNTRWRAGGYQGMQDIGGRLKFGSRLRDDGQADEILISSGQQADITLNSIADVGEYKATRLDLQVTVQLSEPDPKLSSQMYEQLSAQKSVGLGSTGRRKVSHIRSDTGDTLYVGTRKTGRKFFRFYDKSADLGVEKGLLWRVEIQYGRDMAAEALGVYQVIKEKRSAVIDLVTAEFYDATGLKVVSEGKADAEVITTTAPETKSVASKLEWLRICVRPTISFLLEEDLHAEMICALGLKPSVPWEVVEGEN